MADLSALFRPEAVQARSGRALGEIALALPPRSVRISIAAALIAALVLGGLVLGHLPRTTTLTGHLVQGGEAPQLQSTTAGVITALHVRNGQTVVAGQPLLDIDSDSGQAATQAHVLQALDAQRSSVAASITDLQTQIAQRRQRDDERARLSAQSEAQLRAEVTVQAEQSRLLQTQIDRLRPAIAAHLIATNAFDELQSRLLDARLREQDLVHQTLAARTEALAADSSAAEAQDQAARQLEQLRNQQAQQDEHRSSALAGMHRQLRAPVAGVIANLGVQVGAAIQPGQALLVVLPADQPVRAELLAPTAALARLQPNTPVRLQVGDADGEHSVLGRVSSTDAAAQPSGPDAGKCRVWIDVPGRTRGLRAGELVRAVIALPTRSLFTTLTAGG